MPAQRSRRRTTPNERHAVVLHAPDMWPWSKAWLYGLLSGLALYVVVQVLRSLWWVFRGRNNEETDATEDQHIR